MVGIDRFSYYVSQDSESASVSSVVASYAPHLAVQHLRKALVEGDHAATVKIASHYKYSLLFYSYK